MRHDNRGMKHITRPVSDPPLSKTTSKTRGSQDAAPKFKSIRKSSSSLFVAIDGENIALKPTKLSKSSNSFSTNKVIAYEHLTGPAGPKSLTRRGSIDRCSPL